MRPEIRTTDGKGAEGIGRMVLLTLLMLVLAEAGLQLRSQLRTGQSVFTALASGPSFVQDEAVGARLLRPNAVIRGARKEIVSNRYGLRGADFDPQPAPGERRIALLGASTVMGTYASTGQTSSERLEELLNADGGTGHVRVINAGIQGLTVESQARLLGVRVLPLGPSVVLWYPGSNDVACRKPEGQDGARRAPIRLDPPRLPAWVLSTELIVKNTGALRRRPGVANTALEPSFDLPGMQATILAAAGEADRAGARLLLVTAAHSYRSSMPDGEIAQRASSALFFRPCYTPRELATRIDELNAMLRATAGSRGLPLIDAAEAIPADPSLFGDASHFNAAGERRFAEVLAAGLRADGLGDSPP